jgi:hypothetical protein
MSILASLKGKWKMRTTIWVLVAVIVIAGISVGGYFLWDRLTRVSTEELEQIVQRDGVPFEVGSIPEKILDRLASYRVVLVGETHFLQEHRELMIDLIRELHARGFRQFLFEWTQAADWLLADFVEDGGMEPDWTPPLDVGGSMIIAIRDLNRTLPEDEHIEVHAIDMTRDHGGGESFVGSLTALARHLPDQGPLAPILQGNYDTPESQEAQTETLQAELSTRRSELIALWGEHWYDTIVEIVEVEQISIPARAILESNYDESVRLREEGIKQLVDRRLRDFPYGTLINIGATHTQKKQLWGTEIEWLGDYLVHKSQVADGSVIVLAVSAAHVVSLPGSGIPDYDLAASPENELFRVMNQIWPDQIVFLPVDDPLFNSARVPINSEGIIHISARKQHFDAFVLCPLAHREQFDS